MAAILAVKVEDPRSLKLNEFFDYDGKCYGLTRSRALTDTVCIDLADFYEGTVRSEVMWAVPVIFVCEDEDDKEVICGWYEAADVFRRIRRPALFLEGNVVCRSADAVLMPEKEWLPSSVSFANRLYQVIEEGDMTYTLTKAMMDSYSGENECLRGDYIRIGLDPSCRRSYDACIDRCADLALQLMDDKCENIRDIRTLETYARQAVTILPRQADGHYYLAMALYQLGKAKAGMKSAEKALAIEPDAADIIALKGNLLVSLGYADEGAGHLHEAWQISGDEDYLLQEGRIYMFAGRMDKAVECLKKISDPAILEDAGIKLKDMERRWPFLNVRGFSLKKMFKKK